METGNNITPTAMTPTQAIWALLLLPPLNTKFLMRPVDGCDKWKPIASVLKAKHIKKLNKNVSNDDFNSLLHATSSLKVNEKNDQEIFYAKKFETMLQTQEGMPGSSSRRCENEDW